MTQAQHILDRFSDAYVAAMLEGSDRESVLATYELTYSELSANLHERARELNVLYGYLEHAEHPSEDQITNLHTHFALPASTPKVVNAKQGFFGSIASFFTAPSFGYRFATVATVILVALFVWRPWSTMSPTSPSLAPVISDNPQTTAPSATQETPNLPAANNGTPVNPSSNVETAPTFRGKETIIDQKHPVNLPASEDADRLRQLALSKYELGMPKEITVETTSKGSVTVGWEPVDGALSYIIEVKGANDRTFRPVTEVAHPGTRLALRSGDTVNVRVIAASGERKGRPSDAKSIVVP